MDSNARAHLAAHDWHLLDSRPDDDEDAVGSWMLINGQEAALLEIPEHPNLLWAAEKLIDERDLNVRYVMVSHSHEDHLDPAILRRMRKRPRFADAIFLDPIPNLVADVRLELGGQPLWRIHAPKHSFDDVVTIYNGVAMTGDIELEQIDSCKDEVPRETRKSSMDYLAGFEARSGYRVHTIVSAHLNDFRTPVDWRRLFTHG